MPRPKKIDESAVEVKAPDNTEHLRIVFTAAALAGLIARGNGASAEVIIPSALAYADLMVEKFK